MTARLSGTLLKSSACPRVPLVDTRKSTLS
nr:MAG TPA: hypothetical protein [Caudoviricetes sp.]